MSCSTYKSGTDYSGGQRESDSTQLFSPDYDIQMEKLRNLIDQRKYNEAIAFATRFIQRLPLNSFIYAERAMAYFQIGQYEKAFADYEKALKLDPKNWAILSAQGKAYFQKGRLDEAKKSFDQCISLNPNVALNYKYRGEIYWLLGRYDLGIRDANNALEIEPSLSEALLIRSLCSWMKGFHNQAIAEMKRFLKLSSHEMWALNHLGYFMHSTGKHEQARGYFLRAQERSPDALKYIEIYRILARSPKTRKFYDDEILVAKSYLEQGSFEKPQPIRTQPSLAIDSLKILPARVRPDSKFEIVLEYTVTDPAVQQNQIPVKISYSILSWGQDPYELNYSHIMSFNGKRTRRIETLFASGERGDYTIKVFIQYKDMIEQASAELVVK